MITNATTPSIGDIQHKLQAEQDRNVGLAEQAERLEALVASSKKKPKQNLVQTKVRHV